MGGGKGKGKQKSHRSAEEIQHARAVNQRRDESPLPKKSTGSVSRSKARSAAYHAAMSAPVAADLIAEPKEVRFSLPPSLPQRKETRKNKGNTSIKSTREARFSLNTTSPKLEALVKGCYLRTPWS